MGNKYKNNPYVTYNTTVKSEPLVTKLLALISLKRLSPKARALVASIIVTVSLGAAIGSVVSDRAEMNRAVNEAIAMAPEMDAHDLIRNIKVKYGMVDGEEATTDYQIMIQTIENEIINNPDLSNEEKRELLTNLDTDQELINKAFMEASKTPERSVTIVVPKSDENYQINDQIIRENTELMSIICEYADYYYISRDVLVAIAASSVDSNGEINYQNLMQINVSGWRDGISSNWHINTSQGQINVNGFKVNMDPSQMSERSQIYYAATMLAMCLKDSNGDYFKALETYQSGLYNFNRTDDFANKVLNCFLARVNYQKVSLIYYRNDIEDNMYEFDNIFVSDQYREDFVDKWEHLAEDIRAEYSLYDAHTIEEIKATVPKSRS